MNMEALQNSAVDLPNPLYKELYFLIAKFLSGGPCQRASQTLIEELEANEIIPTSVNWLGEAVSQDYRTFSSKFEHINPQHLPKLLDQLIKTINAKESSSSVASRSLLSFSTYSLVTNSPDSPKKSSSGSGFTWSKKYGSNSLFRSSRERKTVINPVHAILDRPLSGGGVNHGLIKPEFFKRIGISCNTLGHLSAVYCVLFDVSGKYIFTGADDHLVKIWSAIDGRLLATLRGTSSEISDLAVNFENTLLAVGSCDKIIRVWCLRTCSPIAVLNGHSGNVSSIFFCPIPRSRSATRYLASTSSDGSCAFWAYYDEPDEPVQFQVKPTLYQERMRPGNAQMICSSFSSGGIFMAAGSADNHVRVYYMLGSDGPERILEVAYHSDRVDSITWAHEGLRFASGSKDGTALIWRFENSSWRFTRLSCGRVPGQPNVVYDDPKRRPRVTMVGWNADDSIVLTAVSDFMVKAWDSRTGELIRVFNEHKDEAYVIEAHPINPRIICTAGHDGKLIIWDIGTTSKEDKGGKVFEYYNQLSEGQGHGAVFDCKWSPDGLSLAATDSHGHLMIFTIEKRNDSKFKPLPPEMFFHTDYRPITRDAISNELVDEQTQIPPHLMPPPFLVDVDGNPYPPDLQRLVPGRENVREEYLVPNVAMSAAGYQEVIEGLPARSNIDVMIQQLAIEQGFGGRNRNRQSGEGDRRGPGLIRSGEVEGVRQSRGDWQTGNYGFPKRYVVAALSRGTLATAEEVRSGWTEFEENWYKEHLMKTSPTNSSGGSAHPVGFPLDSPAGRSRRIRRLALQAAEHRQQEEMRREEFSQIEGVARPNPRPQMEISVNQESPRRPTVRMSGTARTSNGGQQPARRSRQVRYDVRRILRSRGESDIENVDLDNSSSEAHVSASSSDSSSSEDSDSDWGGTLGTSRSREQERRKKPTGDGRKRSQRVNSSPSDPEEEQRESDEDHNEDEPKPGASSEISPPPIKTEPSKPTRPRIARGKKVDYSGGLEEIPEQFRPCEWLSEVIPKRSPYFPQLGDDLVYYRQGHERYINEVESKKMYEIPKKLKKSLPYVQKPELEAEVSVRVVGIKFELEPPRLVALKLSRTDWDTGELTGDYFYVKYHDAANVVDFLIVRQMYDKYIRRKWNEGDKFRCLIQREWWLGTIVSNEPCDSKYPNSMYLCYSVKWDSGEPEKMSPWDMDIITDDFEIPEGYSGNDGIPASEEDQRIGLYESTPSDWPPHGHQDAQCQKISNLLEQVMELAISEAFLTPVDLNLYPDYSYIIEYPVDLSTIKSRVDNRFYRRADALKFDVKYIAMNTEKYNEKESDIVRHGRVIRDLCLEITSNPDLPDVNTTYHTIMKNSVIVKKENNTDDAKPSTSTSSNHKRNSTKSSSSTVRSSTNGHMSTPSKAKKSAKTNHRNASKYHHSESEDDEESWQAQCLELLNKIWHCKDAVPFRQPVDIVDYPDYYHVIDTPMDLQTCKEELRGGNYQSPLEFHKDMSMIFSNSKQYNTDKKSSIYSMTLRMNSMYDCQIKPILNRNRSLKKKSRSGSPPKRSRHGPSRACNSANSTPRKNPKRSAAVKNPYVHNEDSSEDHHSEPPSGHRTRAITKRNANGHRLGGNPMNGHRTSTRNGYPSPRRFNHQPNSPPASRQRAVKRFRISSGESHQSSRSSPRRNAASGSTNSTSTTPSRSAKRQKIDIKRKSRLVSDEFEDSEPMPTLNKVDPAEMDDDYNISDNDSEEDDDGASLRRSTRVRKKRRGDESDDGYGYETRFRGKAVKSYAETQDVTDDDDPRYGKRSRIITRGSPTRSSRGSNQAIDPPVLRQTATRRIVESDDSDEDTGEFGIDPDESEQPGPSSRFMRTPKPSNSQGSRTGLRNQDHQEVDEDENDGSESSEESEENDEEEYSKKVTKRRSTATNRSAGRAAVAVSSDDDDDEYVSSPSRKKKVVSSSSSRRATRGNRPDYAEEDSDSEPRRITVSSRGRVRRTKSFLGE